MRTHLDSLFSSSYTISHEVLDTCVCFSNSKYEPSARFSFTGIFVSLTAPYRSCSFPTPPVGVLSLSYLAALFQFSFLLRARHVDVEGTARFKALSDRIRHSIFDPQICFRILVSTRKCFFFQCPPTDLFRILVSTRKCV